MALFKRVVFSDVDGVFNTPEMRLTDKEALVWEQIAMMKTIVKRHRARVVISSSWRIVFPEHAHKLDLPLHPDWCTAQLGTGKRGDEIAEWLSRHPEVSHYAIVDDHDTFLQEQEPHFIQTQSEVGLTPGEALAIGLRLSH